MAKVANQKIDIFETTSGRIFVEAPGEERSFEEDHVDPILSATVAECPHPANQGFLHAGRAFMMATEMTGHRIGGVIEQAQAP
jgi:hypothetical protein